ncbi:MAG: hypothetical protein WCL18_06410 [bacterium]
MKNIEYVFLRKILEKEVRAEANKLFAIIATLVFGGVVGLFISIPIINPVTITSILVVVTILLILFYTIFYNAVLAENRKITKLTEYYHVNAEAEIAIEGLDLLPQKLMKK